jgi:hypothetical protein
MLGESVSAVASRALEEWQRNSHATSLGDCVSISRKMIAGIALPALAAISLALVSPGSAAAAPVAAKSDVAGVRTVVKIAQPASAAEAAELDLGVLADSHGCSGDEVSDNSYVHVCFVRDGDRIWVKDDEGNGRSAMGQLEFYDAGSWYYGYCLNTNSAASGIWVYCSFSEADENTTAYYRGYDTVGSSVDHFTAWQAESTS